MPICYGKWADHPQGAELPAEAFGNPKARRCKVCDPAYHKDRRRRMKTGSVAHNRPIEESDKEDAFLKKAMVIDSEGTPTLRRPWLMKEILLLYRDADKKGDKLECLKYLAKMDGLDSKPASEKDDAAILRSLRESMRMGKVGGNA